MDFKFPIFLYFLLLFPTNSLSCISVVKKTKADAVNAIANTLTNAAGIVLSSIPKVNNFLVREDLLEYLCPSVPKIYSS